MGCTRSPSGNILCPFFCLWCNLWFLSKCIAVDVVERRFHIFFWSTTRLEMKRQVSHVPLGLCFKSPISAYNTTLGKDNEIALTCPLSGLQHQGCRTPTASQRRRRSTSTCQRCCHLVLFYDSKRLQWLVVSFPYSNTSIQYNMSFMAISFFINNRKTHRKCSQPHVEVHAGFKSSVGLINLYIDTLSDFITR